MGHLIPGNPFQGTRKKTLYAERLSGRFGGPLPPPKYFATVNEGKVPNQDKNIGFVDTIAAEVDTFVEGMVSGMMPT